MKGQVKRGFVGKRRKPQGQMKTSGQPISARNQRRLAAKAAAKNSATGETK